MSHYALLQYQHRLFFRLVCLPLLDISTKQSTLTIDLQKSIQPKAARLPELEIFDIFLHMCDCTKTLTFSKLLKNSKEPYRWKYSKSSNIPASISIVSINIHFSPPMLELIVLLEAYCSRWSVFTGVTVFFHSQELMYFIAVLFELFTKGFSPFSVLDLLCSTKEKRIYQHQKIVPNTGEVQGLVVYMIENGLSPNVYR